MDEDKPLQLYPSRHKKRGETARGSNPTPYQGGNLAESAVYEGNNRCSGGANGTSSAVQTNAHDSPQRLC